MQERRANEQRWVGALEGSDVPLSFIWGLLDPISGAHVAERIRTRLPDAPLTAFDDVGHWPQLEAPERVLQALRGSQPV
jgi:pimeloyl-ACP methyl ester carboxylesterase